MEEEVGGRKMALACIKQAVADLIGVVEKNGRIGSERLGVQGRAELLTEVKDFFLKIYKRQSICGRFVDVIPVFVDVIPVYDRMKPARKTNKSNGYARIRGGAARYVSASLADAIRDGAGACVKNAVESLRFFISASASS